MSDHLPIFANISKPNQNTNTDTNYVRDWKNFNKTEFRNELRRKLNFLSETSSSLNANSKFNRFSKLTKELVNKYLPLRPSTNKEQKRRENPWMTNAIFKSIKTKNKLYFIKLKHRT